MNAVPAERDAPALAGRTVLVAGALGGLGQAASLACERAGARVVLLGRRVPKLDRLLDGIAREQGEAAAYPLDLEGASPDDYAQLAQTIGEACGRLDGDRFGAVLTDASGSGVGDLAERLRQAIAALGAGDARGAHPTVSIGFAQIDAGMRDSAQWFAAAEAALKAAKAAGRNRSMSAPALGLAP